MRPVVHAVVLVTLSAAAVPALALGTLRVKFTSDPTWSNAPLNPSEPVCKSITTIDAPPGGNQFPNDSIVSRFSGGVRTAVVGGASTQPTGLAVRRATLTQQEAAGTGYPGGFNSWPNPGVPGELTGMMWPFRDFMNFASTHTVIPGGFDNSPRNGDLTNFGIFGIDGAQDVASYGRRFNTGNGITGEMQTFLLEFEATDFTPRTIRVTFEPGLIEVTTPAGDVIRDIEFQGASMDIQIVPTPSAAALLAFGAALAARRRR